MNKIYSAIFMLITAAIIVALVVLLGKTIP